jgi:hypothetical protein
MRCPCTNTPGAQPHAVCALESYARADRKARPLNKLIPLRSDRAQVRRLAVAVLFELCDGFLRTSAGSLAIARRHLVTRVEVIVAADTVTVNAAFMQPDQLW